MRTHAPTLGPADVPVMTVESLNPACETCTEFDPLVTAILAANPSRVRVVLRWPLSTRGRRNVVAVLKAALTAKPKASAYHALRRPLGLVSSA